VRENLKSHRTGRKGTEIKKKDTTRNVVALAGEPPSALYPGENEEIISAVGRSLKLKTNRNP